MRDAASKRFAASFFSCFPISTTCTATWYPSPCAKAAKCASSKSIIDPACTGPRNTAWSIARLSASTIFSACAGCKSVSGARSIPGSCEMAAYALAWFTLDHIWFLIGLAGQGLFASRFIVQWFQSEREGRSVIPLAFWYFSVVGGIVSLAYAIYLQSVPFALGQGSGLIVYARNLYLIFRERRLLRQAAAHAEPGA